MASITYTAFRIERKTLLGGEYVSFYIEACLPGGNAYFITTFDDYRKQLQSRHPELAAYIQDIRKGIGGYGPKEWEVLDVLEAEGFEFERYFIEYLDDKPEMVADEFERQQRLLSNPGVMRKLNENLEVLSQYEGGDFINGDKFLDSLEKAILTWLMDNYPELTEAEPDDILALRTLMINHFRPFGEKVLDHITALRRRK